jgi:nucleoside 2-deoxyribosyltransferase
MAPNPKTYLAGPDVFMPDAIAIGQRKKQLCAKYGFDGLYPFDNEILPDKQAIRPDILIFRANIAMISEADFAIINLTPFRGPSADPGTVFELGMLIGLGKPVFGYTNDLDDLLTRVKRTDNVTFDASAKVFRDSKGMAIEDFGNAENLMIESAFVEQGHPIIRHDAREGERFRDLIGFERCLQLSVEAFAARGGVSGRRVGSATDWPRVSRAGHE